MFTATAVTFFGQKFAIWLKKNVPSNMIKGSKIPKKLHSHEKSFEITKIFGGFGRISSFLLLKSPYLANRF
jgi:hypothetical protein